MSAASAKPQDASMEEILASIRRIIADEAEPGAPDAPQAGLAPGRPEPPRADEAPRDHPALLRDHQEADEDVLDLAEWPGAGREAAATLEIDVPDLSFQQVAAAPPPPPPPPVAPPPVPPAAAAGPRAAPEPPPPQAEPRLERIVSDQTRASVGNAFSLLSHTVLAHNSQTIEDVVKEMLRPMLKDWLDDNLPPLVERLVRAEIERVARGAR